MQRRNVFLEGILERLSLVEEEFKSISERPLFTPPLDAARGSPRFRDKLMTELSLLRLVPPKKGSHDPELIDVEDTNGVRCSIVSSE
jgi:hypothetical protein